MTNAALARHGSGAICFDPKTQWRTAPTGGHRRHLVFTDATIPAVPDPEGSLRGPVRAVRPMKFDSDPSGSRLQRSCRRAFSLRVPLSRHGDAFGLAKEGVAAILDFRTGSSRSARTGSNRPKPVLPVVETGLTGQVDELITLPSRHAIAPAAATFRLLNPVPFMPAGTRQSLRQSPPSPRISFHPRREPWAPRGAERAPGG